MNRAPAVSLLLASLALAGCAQERKAPPRGTLLAVWRAYCALPVTCGKSGARATSTFASEASVVARAAAMSAWCASA